MKTNFLLCLGLCQLMISGLGWCQGREADSLFYNQVTAAALSDFPGSRSRLYSGVEYNGLTYDKGTGHPYLGSPYLQTGSVEYENIAYANIPMLYDLAQNQLVIGDARRPNVLLVLDPGKVNQFTLNNRHFVSLPASQNIESGFYEQVYMGLMQVLVQRQKVAKGRIASQNSIRFFNEKNQYLLVKDNTFYPVQSKEDVFQVLADQKKEIQLFVKRENLQYTKDPEKWLVQVSNYYGSLKK